MGRTIDDIPPVGSIVRCVYPNDRYQGKYAEVIAWDHSSPVPSVDHVHVKWLDSGVVPNGISSFPIRHLVTLSSLEQLALQAE